MPHFNAQTPPFPVNTTTRGDQDQAKVIGLPDGGFVMVWEAQAADYAPVNIMMQRFDAAGDPVGENVRVNTVTGIGKVNKDPEIALLDDGSWAVVWHFFDFLSFAQPHSVMVQVFDPEGQTSGAPYSAFTDSLDKAADPTVTALADGDFFVAWEIQGAPFGRATEMRGRVCDADGPVAPVVVLDTGPGQFQNNPELATLSDGQIALVWSEANEITFLGPKDTSVFARILNPDGTPTGEQFEVFAERGQRSISDVISLPGGGFAVVGVGSPLGGLPTSIVVQVFSNAGELIEDVFVRPTEGERVYHPQLAVLPDGGFALTYSVLLERFNYFEEQTDTFLMRFDADGHRLTDPVKVNVESRSGYKTGESDIAVLTDGSLVVSWEGQDLLTYGGDVHARIYAADMFGTPRSDTLEGTASNDQIFALAGHDVVRAGEGDDTVAGGAGRDVLAGGIGNDVLEGGEGNDRLNGGPGADVLIGGPGDDQMIGGGGADEFHFASGQDVIVDFENNSDTIVLDGAALGVAGYLVPDLLDDFAQVVDGNTVFDFGGGNTLTVNGVAVPSVFIDDIIIG